MKGIADMAVAGFRACHEKRRLCVLLPEAGLLGFVLLVSSTAWAGSCETLSPTSANVLSHGIDYLPRLDFHDGSQPPEACAYALPAPRPAHMFLPLHAHNLRGAMVSARFRIVSTTEILAFAPHPGLTEVGGQTPVRDGTCWYLDIALSTFSPLCGPLCLGEVEVLVHAGGQGFHVDVIGHAGELSPVMTGDSSGEVPAVSPRHGAYVGAEDLYHCQPPLCLEPNAPVAVFEPLQSGGKVIELGWVAGEGNFTMIRHRTDGVCPISIHNGELLVLMPTLPGQFYSLYHDDPQVVQYWYTAFSVTMIGEEILLGGRLECDSFTTATVDESILSRRASWGALKTLYR